MLLSPRVPSLHTCSGVMSPARPEAGTLSPVSKAPASAGRWGLGAWRPMCSAGELAGVPLLAPAPPPRVGVGFPQGEAPAAHSWQGRRGNLRGPVPAAPEGPPAASWPCPSWERGGARPHSSAPAPPPSASPNGCLRGPGTLPTLSPPRTCTCPVPACRRGSRAAAAPGGVWAPGQRGARRGGPNPSPHGSARSSLKPSPSRSWGAQTPTVCLAQVGALYSPGTPWNWG